MERVLAHADEEDTVVVTGSFRLLAAARAVVDRFVASQPAPPQFGDVFGVGDDA